jgi:hypothetical protein
VTDSSTLPAELDVGACDHVLLVGEDTLDLMCALLRRGCGAVTVLRPNDPVHPEPADLAILPRLETLAQATQALTLARRALGGSGRVVAQIADAGDELLIRGVQRLLRGLAFSRVRLVRQDGGARIEAEMPCFWPPRPAAAVTVRGHVALQAG